MIGDVGFSDAFWIAIAMGTIFSFLITFIPVFYLSFLLFKAKDVNILVTLLSSFIVGYIVGINNQTHVLSFIGSLNFIHEVVPLIALPFFVVLEIVIVTIHFVKQQKKQKVQKRSRKKS